MAVSDGAFKQPQFAVELKQWLANRASPQDAERCQQVLALIQRTAAAQTGHTGETPLHSARKHSTVKASLMQTAPVRPADACEGGWLYTGTIASLRRGSQSSMLTMAPSARPGTAGRLPSRPGTATSAEAQSRPTTAQAQRQQQGQPGTGTMPQHLLAAVGQQTGLGSRPGTAPATAGQAQATPRHVNPLSVTTSHATYGLKQLYPDLYASILPIARPDPAPNKNFVSEWGEAMRQGAEEAWRPYLQSTYEVNNHIATASKPGSADHRQRAESALAAWVGKQRLYYGDVFSAVQCDAIAKLLGQLQGEERKQLVDMLRQLHAVLQPNRSKPFSHAEHKQQFSVEDEATTKLMKEQTKIRTMGMPKKPKVQGFKTAAPTPPAGTGATWAATAAAADGAAKKKKKVASATEMIETLVSKVPLKQAVAAVAPVSSTYKSTFGGAPPHGTQMEPAPFKDVNVGFGHVDTNLYPGRPGVGGVVPLPAHYVTQPRLPGAAPSGDDLKTTHRNSFMSREQADVMRSVAAAQEQIAESQAARNKSFIPLSKAGIQYGSSKQWSTIYDSNFADKKMDLSANHAMAQAVGGMFNGPTISWGKIAGIRAQPPSPGGTMKQA